MSFPRRQLAARRWLVLQQFAAALLLAVGLAQAGPPDGFDTVVAVPMHNGQVEPRLLPWLRSETPGADGSVRLTLERRFDWVLLLVERDAAPQRRVVGYLTYRPDRAIGGVVSLELSRATLRELARRDDGYRNAVNLYLNYDPRQENWYLPRPRQIWRGGDLETVVNGAPSPGVLRFAGFRVEVRLASADMNAGRLCAGESAVGLFPPQPVVSATGVRFDAATGLHSHGGVTGEDPPCVSGEVGISGPEPGVTALRFPAGGDQGLLQTLPAGWWTLMRPYTGEVLARMEFSADHSVSRHGHSLAFVPVPRLVLAGDDRRVSHVAIDWVRYDVVEQRYVSADPHVMSELLHDSYVELTLGSNGEAVRARVDRHAPQPIRAVGAQRLSDPHRVPGPDVEGGIAALSIGYQMQGVAYRYTWGATAAPQ